MCLGDCVLQLNPADRYHSAAEMSDALAKVKIALDWSVIQSPNGGLIWRASRQDRPDFVVELASCFSGGWSVGVYTARGADVRAKCPAQYRRDALTQKDANAHLKKVFEDLSG